MYRTNVSTNVHCMGRSGIIVCCVLRAEAVTRVIPCSSPARTGAVDERCLADPAKANVGLCRAANARFTEAFVSVANREEDMAVVKMEVAR